MPSTFKYSPLKDGKHFRLLKLLPAYGEDVALKGELIHISLEASGSAPAVPFEALSYVWGDPEEPHRGQIDIRSSDDDEWRTIELRRNCEHALRHLRLKRTLRLLYVDAICNDQGNKKELGGLVAIMGDIYAEAMRVLVWLGPGMRLESPFKDFRRLARIRPLVDMKDRGRIRSLLCRLQRSVYYSKWPPVTGGQNALRFNRWFNLIDSEYFERVWPIQETTLSKQVLLICGHSQVDFEAARFAIRFARPLWAEMTQEMYRSYGMNFREVEFGRRWHGFEAHESLKKVVDLGTTSNSFSRVASNWPYLDQTLRTLRDLNTGRAQDRIFSLHTMFRHFGVDLPTPNYDFSIPRIWITTSIAIMDAFRTLDLITNMICDGQCISHSSRLFCTEAKAFGAELCEDAPVAPRWCYRWDKCNFTAQWMRSFSTFESTDGVRNTPWDHAPRLQYNGELYSLPDGLQALSEREIEPIPGANIDPDLQSVQLLLRGKAFSSVKRTSTRPPFLIKWLDGHKPNGKHDSVNFLAEMTSHFAEWYRMIQSLYSDTKEAQGVFRNLLIWEGGRDLSTYGPEVMAEWIALLEAWTGTEEKLQELIDFKNQELHVQLCGFERFRIVFKTSGGKVGKASYAVEEGDLVVLLCWSRMPAIVRLIKNPLDSRGEQNDSKRYMLVGFAYVDGLMDCRQWDMSGEDLTDFALI